MQTLSKLYPALPYPRNVMTNQGMPRQSLGDGKSPDKRSGLRFPLLTKFPIQGESLQKLTFCTISFRWTNPFLHSSVEGAPARQRDPRQRGRLRLRFRDGLVLKAHRLVYHSTLGWRVIKTNKKMKTPGNSSTWSSLFCAGA